MKFARLEIPSVYFGPFFTEVFRLFDKYRCRKQTHCRDNCTEEKTEMSRIHIALNTNRFDESIEFYSKLFGQPPAKQRENWAKFDLADPALNLTLNHTKEPVQAGQISHLGIEVEDSATVAAMDERLQQLGLKTIPEENTTCCYAVQDKTWVTDPNGHAWEFFHVKADAAESGVETDAEHAPACC
jgi:catechol 2,3-dioxygenase-like lactoylglutathione lyase family enzyme